MRQTNKMVVGGRQMGRTRAAVEGLRAQERHGFDILYVCASKLHEATINQQYPDIPTTSYLSMEPIERKCVLWDHFAVECYVDDKNREIAKLQDDIAIKEFEALLREMDYEAD